MGVNDLSTSVIRCHNHSKATTHSGHQAKYKPINILKGRGASSSQNLKLKERARSTGGASDPPPLDSRLRQREEDEGRLANADHVPFAKMDTPDALIVDASAV